MGRHIFVVVGKDNRYIASFTTKELAQEFCKNQCTDDYSIIYSWLSDGEPLFIVG